MLEIPAGGSRDVRVRLTRARREAVDFDAVFATRIEEADAFYADGHPGRRWTPTGRS